MYFSNIADYERDYPGWSAPVVNMGGNAVAVVPAERDGSVLGVLVVFYAEPRLFTGADRVAIAQVAHEIAIVVESARLRERDRAAAAKLQESLLGPPLMVPDVGHEVRYVAAEAELHVGGDWYNAQRLPDGRTCFAVGDVVGRGLDAAMVMGQLRSALSAFADRSETPADLKVAISPRIRAAARARLMRSAAPVPSPRRIPRSRYGSSASASSTRRCPGSADR